MVEKLVVIGNGMAGIRTVEELLKIAPLMFDITVFGAEPYGNYNRIMLSPVLTGEKTFEEIVTHNEQWYVDNNVTLYKNKSVDVIDRIKRQVIASDGTIADYDRLLIATGSNPFVIPVPGNDLDGVVTFRDMHDVNSMMDAAKIGRAHV